MSEILLNRLDIVSELKTRHGVRMSQAVEPEIRLPDLRCNLLEVSIYSILNERMHVKRTRNTDILP